jgi:ElaA protein
MKGHTITIKPFQALTGMELHDLLRLRVDVFVVEQRCPYAEIDGLDPTAEHVLALDPVDGLIGYARILPTSADDLPHIGRVVVDPRHRNKGVAAELMRAAMEWLAVRYGSPRNAISAQAHLVGMYGRLGYREAGPVYDWDGIPHVDMVFNAEG